jgi:hypothetical protein
VEPGTATVKVIAVIRVAFSVLAPEVAAGVCRRRCIGSRAIHPAEGAVILRRTAPAHWYGCTGTVGDDGTANRATCPASMILGTCRPENV